MSPRDWSPEARKAFGARMRAARSAKESPALTPKQSKPKPSNGAAAAAALNPIANDVLPPTPAPAPAPQRQSKSALKRKPPVASPAPSSFSASRLISSLESIPLEAVSYADCGLLLNALSAASTAVALARRQRQEQLEAGSQRAPCKTCGRMIDISKAGGFQILTERDEFHMPSNSYFCSQQCVLGRFGVSHAKLTPKQKRENTA